MDDRFIVTYEVTTPYDAAIKIAQAIAFEETVEVPLDFPLPQKILDNIVGRVVTVKEITNGRVRIEIDFPTQLASNRIGTLLNLLFGNASIWPELKLIHVLWPKSFLAAFKGPNFGVEGLRKILGVPHRPLLATALKPGGSSDSELATIAAAFARGGGDIAKDDQNIVDASLRHFKLRVTAIAKAVKNENRRHKHQCLYFPHLSGPQEELETRLKFVLKLGLKGVLICPAIVGLDTVRYLSDKYRAIFMAHPAFSGAFYAEKSHGIETSFYLGSLMRLIGADITVFPNFGGRFGFTKGECHAIAQRAQAPMGQFKSCWAAPGGGMRLDTVGNMVEFGNDAIWLVGGSLLMHPEGAEGGAKAFRQIIDREFSRK